LLKEVYEIETIFCECLAFPVSFDESISFWNWLRCVSITLLCRSSLDVWCSVAWLAN